MNKNNKRSRQQQFGFIPRVFRIPEALYYTGTTINFFNKRIRPHLGIVPTGESRAIGFDKVDLDRWVDNNKGRGKWRPTTEGDSLWDENAYQDSTNVEANGTLTKSSAEEDFTKTLEQVRSMKQKKF